MLSIATFIVTVFVVLVIYAVVGIFGNFDDKGGNGE